MSRTTLEIASQPACWRAAARLAPHATRGRQLPPAGLDVAVVGCGTSLFMARAYAALREASGRGRTDAFPASEYPAARGYPFVLAICRSGTTTEVVQLLERLPAGSDSLVITAVAGTPAPGAARRSLVLDFADEESVVQTRFATTTLALLRASLGADAGRMAGDAERALEAPLPLDPRRVEQVSFLGAGWTFGLAEEAALKLREAAQFWAESYHAMEYRHGPISIAAPGRAVWPFSVLPPGLADQIGATGAALVDTGDLDPWPRSSWRSASRSRRPACRGLDPDRPRALTRSVILSDRGKTP